mmetsp:Transcript_4078/g.10533  ORF Transcript_4078/g.10533 Transcript_4078/m.10533 type:complete len:352 (+) Transcript_4078:547-1602(+)
MVRRASPCMSKRTAEDASASASSRPSSTLATAALSARCTRLLKVLSPSSSDVESCRPANDSLVFTWKSTRACATAPCCAFTAGVATGGEATEADVSRTTSTRKGVGTSEPPTARAVRVACTSHAMTSPPLRAGASQRIVIVSDDCGGCESREAPSPASFAAPSSSSSSSKSSAALASLAARARATASRLCHAPATSCSIASCALAAAVCAVLTLPAEPCELSVPSVSASHWCAPPTKCERHAAQRWDTSGPTMVLSPVDAIVRAVPSARSSERMMASCAPAQTASIASQIHRSCCFFASRGTCACVLVTKAAYRDLAITSRMQSTMYGHWCRCSPRGQLSPSQTPRPHVRQ